MKDTVNSLLRQSQGLPLRLRGRLRCIQKRENFYEP